jgi:hypothetical protein
MGARRGIRERVDDFLVYEWNRDVEHAHENDDDGAGDRAQLRCKPEHVVALGLDPCQMLPSFPTQ